MDAIPNYLQIFLRMRPAAILLHGAAATNPRFKGTGCSGQWGSPKELRASGAPLKQAVDGRRLRRYMLAPKRPTPVRRRFKVTHSLRGRSAPGGMCVPGGWWAAHALCRLLPIMFHCSIRLKLEFVRDAAWRLKGRRERRRWRLRFWAVAMRACKRWVVFSRAFLISVDVWCSLRSAGGGIPERTGRYFTGVGRRQPLTILKVSLRVTSSFFLRGCSCTMLGQHILQRYRRVRGRLFGVWVRVWAPQNEPARRRRRLFLDATLPRSASMCYLKVSCLSSFTLREIGVELYGSVEPTSLTVVQFLSNYTSARSSAYAYLDDEVEGRSMK